MNVISPLRRPITQTQQTQRQNQQGRSKCVIFLIIYSCIIQILLIVEDCLSIAVSKLNSNQEQILIIGVLNIFAAIFKILILASFIYSLIKLKSGSSYAEQFQYLGMFYLLIYICAFQIYMVAPFLLQDDCTESMSKQYCEKHLKPKYIGKNTIGLANYVIASNCFIFALIFVLSFIMMSVLAHLIEVKPYNLEMSEILETQKKAIFALYLFMFYSLCRIILYIIILIINQNESMQYLVYSNLCYHFIMVIVWLKIILSIRGDKEGKYNQINYMFLIFKVSKIKSNFIFLLLSWLSLGFTIFGFIKYEHNSQKIETILNLENFVSFDCFIIRLGSLALFLFFYAGFQQRDSNISDEQNRNNQVQDQYDNQQLNLNQQIYLESVSQKKKPFIYNVQIEESQNCSICLQKLNYRKNVQLNCHNSHVFHQQCIEKWLKVHQKCPLCNTEFKLK